MAQGAAIEFIYITLNDLHKGLAPFSIYLYVKAFDTLNHKILLYIIALEEWKINALML